MRIRNIDAWIMLPLIIAAFWWQQFCPLHAQMPQGFTEGTLVFQMQHIPGLLREYYQSNFSLPSQPQGFDELLKKICASLFGSVPKQQPTSVGAYRALGTFRIACDENVTCRPVEQLRQHPPENWNAPANTISIVTDGKSRYVIWAAALSGNPIVDSDQRAIIFSGDLAQ
jgi:hypothetical protein